MPAPAMRERIIAGGALAGLLALVAVALVVFQFGRNNPSPPSLIDNPNPAIPGEILYRNGDNCVVRATASGTTRAEVYCGDPTSIPNGAAGVLWVDEQTIGFVSYSKTDSGRADLVEVDLATKTETLRTGAVEASLAWDQGAISLTGDKATMDEDGTLVITREGVRTEVTKFDVDDAYRLVPTGWSPDGQWLVISYSPPRDRGPKIWIVSRDGQTRGTLVRDTNWRYSPSGRVSWLIPGVGVYPEIK